MFHRILVLAAVVALLGAALTAGPVLAGKGGKGGHNSSVGYGSCYVTPNPVAAGAEFTIYGSKYAPGEGLTLRIKDAMGSTFRWTIADANGNFTTTSRVSYPGANTASVYDTLTSKLLGSCSFQSY